MLHHRILKMIFVFATSLGASAGCGPVALDSQPRIETEQRLVRKTADEQTETKASHRRLKPEGGFWLQSRLHPELCLAAQDPNMPIGSTVGLAPCRAVPSQVLFQYAGNFGFSPSACLTAPSELGAPIVLSNCEFRADKHWGLDGEDHALYAEIRFAGNANYTLTALASDPNAGNLAANGNSPGEPDTDHEAQKWLGAPLVLVAYDAATAHPFAIKTPPRIRGQRIFYAADPNLCLTDFHHGVGLTLCNPNVRDQIWRFDNRAIRSHDGACLTLGNTNQTLAMRTCKEHPRQAWELSLGLLMPSALRDGPGVSALDYNQLTKEVDVGFSLTTYLTWSIGWPLYLDSVWP